MLDVGWSEILVIAVVMVVVVGPKDLPKMLRAFGKASTRMRTTANEFKRQFDDALKEAELDDVKTIIDETRKLDPRGKMTQVFDPIRSAGNDLKASLNQTPKPEQSAKPADLAANKDNAAEATAQAETAQAADAQPETKTPADAIAEAVKKSLPEAKAVETAAPVKAKAAPKPRTTASKAASAKAAPAKATSAKAATTKAATKPAAAKPAAKTTAAKSSPAKPATAKATPNKTAAKKAPAKKPAAKTTGTNE